jgi:hypothetical protein
LGTALTTALLMSGCGDSDDFVFTNTNVQTAPVAVNDAFNALGNATVNQAATGVLANDTVNAAAISAFDAVGSNGGAITLNADGSFSYTPVAGFVGAETFTYTLSNNAGASTATVTMTSTGLGHFVDNTAAPGGDGSQASPFDTLAAAIGAANAGDTIFVARGDGTSNGLAGAINLPAGVDLVGEGAGLVVAQTIVLPGIAPLITGPIICAGENIVSGLMIDGSAADGIVIDGVGNVTVSKNTISNPAERHIDCDNVTGTISIADNTFSDPPNDGSSDVISIENNNTNGTVSIVDNIFQNDSDNDVDDLTWVLTEGNSTMSVSFERNDAIGGAADEFFHGFYAVADDQSSLAVNVADNNFSNFEGVPIAMFADNPGTTIGGSTTGNMISNVSNEPGIEAFINESTLTVSGNVITGVSNHVGLDLEVGDVGTFVVANNNTTNTDGPGLLALNVEGGDMKIALRDNSFTNSNSAPSVVIVTDGGDACADFTGNTVDEDVLLIDDGPGAFSVEQFDMILTLNTFIAPATVDVPEEPIVNVADGFCQIP